MSIACIQWKWNVFCELRTAFLNVIQADNNFNMTTLEGTVS